MTEDKSEEPACICDVKNIDKKTNKMAYEEIVTGLEGGEINWVARNWPVQCPVHGTRIKQKFGHHQTASSPSARFTKAQLRSIANKLRGEERKNFKRAVTGHYLANPEQITRWSGLADA